jgi:hydroxymethylpyrimidine/phosphomethylpyrimidine kinase
VTPPVALTVAGSDPVAGAGIQADLKTFAAQGVYGASVLTAVTAQNGRGVYAVEVLPARLVRAQLDAVLVDLPVAAVKVGMLPDPEVAQALAARDLPPLVLDPVLLSSTGSRLGALAAVKLLLPRAAVVTPNLAEARALAGDPDAGAEEAAELIGAPCVVVTGAEGDGVDLVWTPDRTWYLREAPVDTANTHGTGCTFSSAIAARLAYGDSVPEAVERAKAYVTGALRAAAGWRLGSGAGPLDHFWCKEA